MYYQKIKLRPCEMSLAVVGLDYPNNDKSNRRFEMLLCKRGEPVRLLLEPKNQADERAIAVLSTRGVQLGYLTAERAWLIQPWLQAGQPYDAVFQEASRWQRSFVRASARARRSCRSSAPTSSTTGARWSTATMSIGAVEGIAWVPRPNRHARARRSPGFFATMAEG